MKNYISSKLLALLFLICFGMTSFGLRAQTCPTAPIQIEVGRSLTGTTLSIFAQSNVDVPTAPCNFWGAGSQITMRWPTVAGNNPLTALTFNAGTLGFAQNPGFGTTGTDGGDGFYYVQFTSSGFGNQNFTNGTDLELFSFDFTASSLPVFEFVPSGTGTIFTNTDPALFVGLANRFTGFIVGGPLPVEWTHFEAKAMENNEVSLSWGTASEINHDHFLIEKSVDAQVFETIGEVAGKGSFDRKQEYSFLDTDFVSETVFYRLKQVDIDGKYEYSNVEEVKLSGDLLSQLSFEISPNPATEKVSFTYIGKQKGEYKLVIVDAFGKQVLKETFDLDQGVFTMPVEQLSEGMYFASLMSSKGVHYSVGKFLKH